MPGAQPDYFGVKQLLAVEAEAVVEALASSVEWEAGEMHAHFPSGLSAVVAMRGSKRGVWLDKSDNSGGDILELVHRVLGKEDHRVALDWGKRFLGLPEAARDARTALAERRKVIEQRQADAVEEKRQQTERTRGAIRRYLEGSAPIYRAPEIGQYLLTRGIPLEGLPAALRTLRFSSEEYHKESGRAFPAMVAPIVDPLSQAIIAVHKTYLALTDGAWRKAPVKPVKRVSGQYKGGLIPLLRGASGKPLREAPEGDVAMIAEGIENALAAAHFVQLGLLELERAPRVFAGVSAPNLPHIKLPAAFAEVILICDRDPEARESVQSAYREAERAWLAAGLAVSKQKPPVGHKDFAAAAEALHAK